MNAEERRRYYAKETVRAEVQPGQLPIRQFQCRQCGKTVEVFDAADKRTVFCTRAHEKKYWRDQTKYKNRSGNIGLSGGMSLHSLIRRESRDLD